MIDVVAGEHPDEMLDRLAPAFRVHAVVVPLLRRERFEKRQVRLSHDAEQLQRFQRIARGVASGRRPRVLIVGGDRPARRAEDGANAIGADDLGVGEVREDFADGPMRGRRPRAQGLVRHAVDQASERLRRCALNGQRLLSLDVPEDALRVLLRCFGHQNLATLRAAPVSSRMCMPVLARSTM